MVPVNLVIVFVMVGQLYKPTESVSDCEMGGWRTCHGEASRQQGDGSFRLNRCPVND